MDKEAQPNEAQSDKDGSTWAHDQQKHDYYYDDSHGYEIYDPEADIDDEDEELNSTKLATGQFPVTPNNGL